jgi:glycosyltransferase involved in cell wall biosynthesis
MGIHNKTVAVVIPAYKAAGTIEGVVNQIPDYVDWIIIVNDASPDTLMEAVDHLTDPRIIVLSHEKNRGVGGAMITGYQKALELGANLIAKIDADGQMAPEYLERFARVVLVHKCDYVKANRFGHIEALPSMPKIRLIGSLILTFLTKFASGYWNVFDPQNGYTMITRQMLRRLDLNRLDHGYFFENSMLINLNIVKARIGEIYLPAQYGNEISSMNLSKIIRTFPLKLFNGFMFRIYHKYIFRTVSPFALLLIFGLTSMAWGSIWGAIAWYKSISTGIPAMTGTVILALLPLLMGWVAILQAVVLDVQDAGPCVLFDYDDESLLKDS